MLNKSRFKNGWLVIITLCHTSLLVSCFPANSAEIQRATCNNLKSKIVFNGATSDTRRAEIERAQKPLDEYNYDVACEKS